MSSNRITVAITIDKDIWTLADVLLPCNRSRFIEKAIIDYINSIDDVEELEREIKEDENKLAIKRRKLSEMKKVRDENTKNEAKINKAMETAFKIVLAHDEISEGQIRNIAHLNMIDTSVLRDRIERQGFKITKFTKEEHETTVKKLKI